MESCGEKGHGGTEIHAGEAARRSGVRYGVGLICVVLLASIAAMSSSGAQQTGMVSGSVTLDGSPLPDVEVFLWVGFPRLTCTDANGEFEFVDVPFDVDLLSATGVGDPARCHNFRFLAPNRDVLLTQFYEGNDGV